MSPTDTNARWKEHNLDFVSCPVGVAQGWGERIMQLEPAGSAKRWFELARRTWTSAAVAAVAY